MTQRFATDQSALVARLAVAALLTLYVDRLGDLRDRASTYRRFRRPVMEARSLDYYLIGDGLDAETITSDVAVLCADLTRFRLHLPQYVEDRSRRASGGPPDEPRQLAPQLCAVLRAQAARLSSDTAVTTRNIRASAELRQAIANTRLQRTVFVVSLAALIVAMITLMAT